MTVYGRAMVEVGRADWPFFANLETEALRVWRSADYMAVLYRQRIDGRVRLTVNSTRTKPVPVSRSRTGKDFRDGITWDELQRVKNECLGPETWCVEVYPAQSECLDIMNQRHLWVLDDAPETRFPTEKFVSDADVENALRIVREIVGRKR